MNPWLSRALSCALLAACAAGCSRSHEGDDEREHPSEGPEPAGDLSRFADISLYVRVAEIDQEPWPPPDDADPLTAPFSRTLNITVTVNGGHSEGRVRDLALEFAGAALREVGSAGWPQQFSYQHTRESRPGQLPWLVLRLGDATFPLQLATRSVEISAPRMGETVPQGDLSVRWNRDAPEPSALLLGTSGSLNEPCTPPMEDTSYGAGQGRFTFATSAPDTNIAGCLANVSVTWNEPLATPDEHPFASLELGLNTGRRRRFRFAPAAP